MIFTSTSQSYILTPVTNQSKYLEQMCNGNDKCISITRKTQHIYGIFVKWIIQQNNLLSSQGDQRYNVLGTCLNFFSLKILTKSKNKKWIK